jgi:hypothetical protein
MAKETPVHLDRLGREIQLDACVAFPDSNSLVIGKVKKINPKMVGIELLNSEWQGYYNKYPRDCVVLDSQDVTLWLLKG